MPEIETERLLLRMFTPEDADAMYERVWTDPEVMRYVMPDGWPYLREASAGILARLNARWDEFGFGQWAVVPKGEERAIGYCGLKHLDETPEVELLYGIARGYWNRGLTTEAAAASLRFGFEEAKLPYVVAIARPGNVGSQRVMEKAGMWREGLARHYGLEVVRYSLSRGEYRPGGGTYVLRA